MRVLLVISDLGFGGAERQVVALVNGLGSQGIEAFVATLSPHIPLADQLSTRNRLHVVGHSPFRLARLLKELKIDVVHGFLLDAEILSRLAARIAGGVRVIGSERSTRHDYTWWQHGLYRVTRSLMTVCVANTDEGARWHSSTFGIPADRYRVVRNGVDDERFTPGSAVGIRQSLGVTSSDVLIGMFASFKPVKNHQLLIQALALLRDRGVAFKALLVGDRMERGRHARDGMVTRIQKLIRDHQLEDRMIMLGHRDDIENLYRACSVTVLPSDYEGTPNVVIESMACGIPAVLSDAPGNREVALNCGGVCLFSAGKAQELAKVLVELLTEPDSLNEFRERARIDVGVHYGMARMLKEMSTVYHSLAT